MRHAATVEELATVYEDEHLHLKKSSTRKRVEGLLRRVILPSLGRQNAMLTRADVLRMHRGLSDKPVEETGRSPCSTACSPGAKNGSTSGFRRQPVPGSASTPMSRRRSNSALGAAKFYDPPQT